MGNYISKEVEYRSLKAIENSGISLTPENLEVWQAHSSGTNANLSADINRYFNELGEIDDSICDRLYKQYFSHSCITRNIQICLQRMHNLLDQEVASVSDLLEDHTAKREENFSNGETTEVMQQLMQHIMRTTRELTGLSHSIDDQLEIAQQSISSLRRMSMSGHHTKELDPETGVSARSVFELRLMQYALDQVSYPEVCVMMVRITDKFHSDQEQYSALCYEAARIINNNIKGQDLLSRFDSNTFAVLLPLTRISSADGLASKIRGQLYEKLQSDITADTNDTLAYIGIASFKYPEIPTKLIDRAYACSKVAESLGSDSVICEDSDEMRNKIDPQNSFTLRQQNSLSAS